jgi:hypothetical protein
MFKSGSKYLGKVFDGWKVVDRKSAPGNHYIYTLKTKKGLTIRTMTVRDNELTKFTKGKTIQNEMSGKAYELVKNIRINPNTVYKHRSLFNLFRSI